MANNMEYIGTVVTGSSISVRSGPSLSYPIVSSDTLSNGDTVLVHNLERHGDTTWGKIEEGWVIITQGNKTFISLKEQKVATFARRSTSTSGASPVQYIGEASTGNIPTTFKSNNVPYNNPSRASTRVFGMPYQFNDLADIRYESVSGEVGRKYAEHYFYESPFFYVIPGKVNYLPGSSKGTKQATSHALINAAGGDMGPLKQHLKKNKEKYLRYYDFQEDYANYIHYVDGMCRTIAAYLELEQTIPNGGKNQSCQSYSWKNYRWTSDTYIHGVSSSFKTLTNKVYKSTVGRLVSKNTKSSANSGTAGNTQVDLSYSHASDSDLEDIGTTHNYVQFFCNPLQAQENFNNATSDSSIKQAIDSATGSMKEIQFIANTVTGGGMNEFQEWSGESLAQLSDAIAGNQTSAVGSALNKIIQGGSAVLRGDSIMIPKYYSDSDNTKQTQVTIELKAPYGDKFSIYMDVLVPLCHLIALALPKQSSSNTYGSPFLVKAYCPGVFNVGLGIVDTISIDKATSPESWSVDGLPMEITVTLNIQELYSTLSMSRSGDVKLFMNNSSLLEFLANSAGINLIEPQFKNKWRAFVSNFTSKISDIPGNATSLVLDTIESKFAGFFSL